MADKTGIEWTDASWNPVRGCSRVSEGCRHCYAETQAARIIRCDRGRGVPEGEGSYDGLLARTGQWNGEIRTVPELLTKPLRWKRPRRIFVNSMSDLFHEGVPDEYIAQVFSVMDAARQHTFQILTKRPERMRDWCLRVDEGCEALARDFMEVDDPTGRDHQWQGPWPLPNVWLGVSAEDQATADQRIPRLLETPAAVRWISAEPLLGQIDLHRIYRIAGTGGLLPPIDWVVVGGESGTGARPMHPDWARSLRDYCVTANVPFLFKQWGEWAETGPEGCTDIIVAPDGRTCAFNRKAMFTMDTEKRLFRAQRMYRVGKKRAGRHLDGVIWDQYPS